ncbi:MAG: AAA family ATPase, partial [Gammaproteobacteria bacterium]
MNAVAEQRPQRRQLTVLFCDLVGSTALSRQLDPEDLREVITAYRNTCVPIIARYDGFVQQYVGDGISVLFGYPVAHEDDAGRAAYAGLGIVNAMPGLSASLRKLGVDELQVRIGIATGLVVAGERQGSGSAQVETIIGETPNLAARLQNLAEPNSVIVGASTQQLLGTSFEYVDLGAHEIKGFDAAVAAYRVLRPSRARTRFEASRLANIAPLVNRGVERQTLAELWRESRAGRGQAVYISGEPGIGKSRLTLAMGDYLKNEDHFRLRYQCSPYYTNSPMYPVIDQMVRAAGFLREDSGEERYRKLAHLLQVSSDEPDTVLGLFAQLLSLNVSNDPRAGPKPPGAELNVSPERVRELTFDALVNQMQGLARQKPVLLVFEDVQWIDPTSAELLAAAINAIVDLPVMIMATSRTGC